MKQDALKPCPFCGKKQAKNIGYCGVKYIKCYNVKCGVMPSTRAYGTREEAIKAWNKRVEVEK